jgi:membrane protein implicated in regulation of membrane protease activity
MDKSLIPQTYVISVLKDVYHSARNNFFGITKGLWFLSWIILGSILSIYGTFLMNILTLFFNVDSTTARGDSKWTIRFLMITLMVICTSLLILYKRVDRYNDNPYQNNKDEDITDEDMELYPKYWEIQMAAIDNENDTKGDEITRDELDKLKFSALFGPIANYESNKDIIMDEATCSSDSQGEVTFYGMGPFFWLLLVTVLLIGQIIYSKMRVSSKLTEKESMIGKAGSWASSKLEDGNKPTWLKILNLISKIFIKSSPFIIVILTILVWYHEYVGDMPLSGEMITDFLKGLYGLVFG